MIGDDGICLGMQSTGQSEADRWNQKYTIGNLRNEGDFSILRAISERKPAGNAVPVKPVLERFIPVLF